MNFTKYANQKFDILNKHKVFITKEMVEEAVTSPDKVEKKEKYFFSEKEGVRVVYKKDGGMVSVITFYPVK